MTLREAAQMALKAIENGESFDVLSNEVFKALEEALNEPPVAYRFDYKDGQGFCYYDDRWPNFYIPQDAEPLYK